jgi:hypothetical protein
MILMPMPVSSKLFTYANQTFVSELSMFKGKAFGQVFDDACDEGFSVISEKTGNHVVFAFDHYDHDGEGDMTAMHFKCVTPGFKTLTAVLLND